MTQTQTPRKPRGKKPCAETQFYIYNPLFDECPRLDWLNKPDYRKAVGGLESIGFTQFFPEVPEDIKPRKSKPITSQQEVALFLVYNCARYDLARYSENHNGDTNQKKLQSLQQRVANIKNDLTQVNMPLVLAMARRVHILYTEFSELISEGNMALLRAIDKFDVSRGFKFSTYACRAILGSFQRLARKTGAYHKNIPVNYDSELDDKGDGNNRTSTNHEEQTQISLDFLRDALSLNTADLSEREQTVIMERFALASREPHGRTLKEVGKIIGISYERVRQILDQALGKLHGVLEPALERGYQGNEPQQYGVGSLLKQKFSGKTSQK